MKKFLIISIFMGLFVLRPGVSWGAAQAVATSTPAAKASFYSVTGKVTVRSKKGNTRTVQRGSTAKEGETVNVSKSGQATLQFFDGSELDLKPHTKLVLSKLDQATPLQKNIKFNLKFGELLARVKKLLTPNSSFEVEAGGSVCGVRGTQFDYAYDADKNKLNLQVLEGTVYLTYGGNTTFYHGGDKLELSNGHFHHSPDHGEGTGHNGLVGGALGDLNNQFTQGNSINKDNTLGQNGVMGTKKFNITVNVPGN